MSDHSLKRRFLFCILFLFTASGAFAVTPSARYDARMVWDTALHRAVLFGGITGVDAGGTKLAFEFNDTWEWTGSRWVQRFLAHSPPARASEAMVYDDAHAKVVIFGGRQGKDNFNDTWTYDGNDWTQLAPATSPSVREISGAAFDSDRGRMVLFGGTHQVYSADGRTLTETPLHDTWEFDGTNWTQILADGPAVTKPVLAYDPVRKQTIMIGFDSKVATVMYAYDPIAVKWNQLTPALLPSCANEGAMTWQGSNNTILFTGGICANSTGAENTYEWDGTNWTLVPLTLAIGNIYFGEAITYDPDHQNIVLFGGAPAAGSLLAFTYLYGNGIWAQVGDSAYPTPRSVFAFTTDPVHNVIYLYGGLNDVTTFSDFWIYQNGQLREDTSGTAPTGCTGPIAAFDTDRQKLVLMCSDSSTWEYDGTTWTAFTGASSKNPAPPVHTFSSLVYDQTLKKIVFFGGYDTNYLDQTWTYDGTIWVQVKKNPPTSRSHASMWYDATLKKTVIYGGIGRLKPDDKITRYSDMWSFDGTGWVAVTPATTPGIRYGAETVVDPRTGHAFIFGGIRVDTSATNIQTQVYPNDMWEWDGTNWTKVNTAVTPPARENGGFAFDPLRQELVLFAGYSGFYLSDLWTFKNGNWSQVFEVLNRRRAAH